MNNYGKLERLCVLLRALVYEECDTRAAQGFLPELYSLLGCLPTNDTSILGAETQAIYHELCGNMSQALVWRIREVKLMEQLFEDIRRNNYDETTKNALLAGRDEGALRVRKAIIESLRGKLKE